MHARVAISLLFIFRSVIATAQPPEKILLNTDKQWYYPGESIWLSINTFNACSNKLMQLSGVAYIELVGSDGNAVIRSKIKIDDAIGRGTLNIDDNIASGVYNLVVYTNWMKNFGKSSFARKPVYVVNPSKAGIVNVNYSMPQHTETTISSLKLEVGKQQYSKRESVAIKFSAGKAARLTVSAYRVDELEKGMQHTYMSQIAEPCNAIITGRPKFSVENEGQVIVGKVTDKQTHMPAKGVRYYVSSAGFPEIFSTAISDSSGTIRFLAGYAAGKSELVVQPEAPSNDNYPIELMSPFGDSTGATPEKGNDDVFGRNGATIDEAMISAQVQKIFAGKAVADPRDTAGKVVFYARPDAYYLMSDYVHFNSVEEILREIVTTVNVRKRQGKIFPVVLNLYSKKPYPKPPLILVNGVPVFNVDDFMKMNTDDFHSISVKTRSYYIGSAVFYGILDVRLKTPFVDLPANSQVVDFEGIQGKAEFVAPDYSNDERRNDRKPDFRNVLYWNPQLESDSGDGNIQFYTSDLEGDYVIVVQAISKDGQVTTSKTSIQVK